jgi:uncharacterized membrane protein YhaH (DUF805 family)
MVFEERRKKLTNSIILYNFAENAILFLTLLNSVIYPSASTAVYYVLAIFLTLMSLVRELKVIKLKFIMAILFLVASVSLMVTKGVFLILLNNKGYITLTPDERLLYDSIGIRID